jgi:hypothetical protein
MATPDLAQDIPNVRHEPIVERAVMAPDIAKADADGYLDLDCLYSSNQAPEKDSEEMAEAMNVRIT